MSLDPEDQACVVRHAEVLEEFKHFCQTKGSGSDLTEEEKDYCGDEPFEDADFHDLSVGFFIAKGCGLIDAFRLARISRYTFGYWC